MSSPRVKKLVDFQKKTSNLCSEQATEIIYKNIEKEVSDKVCTNSENLKKEELIHDEEVQNILSFTNYIKDFIELDRLRVKEIEKLKKENSEMSSQVSSKTCTLDEAREYYKKHPRKKVFEDALKLFKNQ